MKGGHASPQIVNSKKVSKVCRAVEYSIKIVYSLPVEFLVEACTKWQMNELEINGLVINTFWQMVVGKLAV